MILLVLCYTYVVNSLRNAYTFTKAKTSVEKYLNKAPVGFHKAFSVWGGVA